MSSTAPVTKGDALVKSKIKAVTGANESPISSEDVSQPPHTDPSPKAQELGGLQVDKVGKAVRRALARHFHFGHLLDDVELLYKVEWVFSKLLSQWRLLRSPMVDDASKAGYVAEALIAADPSAKEAKNDPVFLTIKATLEVLDRAPWSEEIHTSGHYVWRITLQNITTPLLLFLCEVQNAIKVIGMEQEGGAAALSVIEARVGAEMRGRPQLRTPYVGVRNQQQEAKIWAQAMVDYVLVEFQRNIRAMNATAT